MARLFTLSAKERIKSRKDIETLFRSGKAFFVFPFKVIYRIGEEAGGLQFMVSVPKKQFKRANDRNKIKRQTREAWRTQNLVLKEKIIITGRKTQVAFLLQTKESIPFQTISEAVKKSVHKLEEIASK